MRPAGWFVTESERRQIKDLHSTGLSARKIAGVIGRSRDLVHRVIADQQNPLNQWSSEETAQAKQMLEEGCTRREIAEAVGRTRAATISHCWREQMRKRPEPEPEDDEDDELFNLWKKATMR